MFGWSKPFLHQHTTPAGEGSHKETTPPEDGHGAGGGKCEKTSEDTHETELLRPDRKCKSFVLWLEVYSS